MPLEEQGETIPLPESRGGFPIVGIGASAGGLEALEAFFKAMPPVNGMAFVIVSHLNPTHASLLPNLLQKSTAMSVQQVADAMKVQPDSVYVIPPNKDLVILNGALQLLEVSQPRYANLPIDRFFRSLARDQGANAICIILSGTGTDGTVGLKAIKGRIGMVMVQEESSAKYDGMPRSAIATGLADYVLPAEKMPEQLILYTSRAMHRRPRPSVISTTTPVDSLQEIFVLLRNHTQNDFSLYKKNTIWRRIERRMSVHQIDNLSDYVRYLQQSGQEVNILSKELLIGVTSFFRDPEAFDALKEKALLPLLRAKPLGASVRVWLPGCSSGEEPYSVAILLQECMEELKLHLNVQIFGTDLDEDAIETARSGVYPANLVADLSPVRLERFFTQEDDGQFRVKKTIREMLIFAKQNLINDPPFTKLDLLCCRNLLIYFSSELQKKLLPIFHYSLVPDGVLFLGSSETIGSALDVFTQLDQKWKIYQRRSTPSIFHPILNLPSSSAPPSQVSKVVPQVLRKGEELSALSLVEAILQQSRSPPCAVIDDECNVLYIHGRTGHFLEPAEGKVSVNIVSMARPGLKLELADAVRKVIRHNREVVCQGLRVEHNGADLCVDLTVNPILENGGRRGLMLVVFEQVTSPAQDQAEPEPLPAVDLARTLDVVEKELRHTRETLQSTIEELQSSNEELKSANEELQSTNEELQSTNEELETSKEELQSLNEESVTINAELQSRIEELSAANDDMKNLLDSTDLATLFLDTRLGIRRFTPKTTEIFPLTASDIGRPIQHFSTRLLDADLAGVANAVLEDLVTRQHEVKGTAGEVFLLRARPYRTVANVIDGVVFTIEEITERKKAEEELRQARDQLERRAEKQTAELRDTNEQLFQKTRESRLLGESLRRSEERELSRIGSTAIRQGETEQQVDVPSQDRSDGSD